jgi:hypothetical protein
MAQAPAAVLASAISHRSPRTESSSSPSLSTVTREAVGASLPSLTWMMCCVAPSNGPTIASVMSSGLPLRAASAAALRYSAAPLVFMLSTGRSTSDRLASAAKTFDAINAIDNTSIDVDVAGHVVGAEVADLNVDRSPELYVYVRGPAPEQRGTLVAVSANNRKSLSFINLPDLSTHTGASKGYQGHDDMAVVEGSFVRRYPLFAGDPPRPTGRTRQLQYKLARGEASWVLKLDRMLEY